MVSTLARRTEWIIFARRAYKVVVRDWSKLNGLGLSANVFPLNDYLDLCRMFFTDLCKIYRPFIHTN